MKVYFTQTWQTNPWKNLAVEAAIADRIGPGDVCLYLWQNDRTVVVGKGQNALRECRGELLEREGGYLARRTTGGGAVYHDMGNLCFTFAASPEIYDLQRQMKVVMDACRMFGISTQLSGRNDIITEDGYKFSGNAFSVRSSCQIQHGTLMVNVQREALQRYLTPSPLKLKAKGISSVQSRVCNLMELCPRITTDLLRDALKEAFCAAYGSYVEVPPEAFGPEAIEQYFQKFSSWEWRFGKSPACEVTFEHLFPWGEVQIRLHVDKMLIRECQVFSDCLDTAYTDQMRAFLLGRRFAPGEWTLAGEENPGTQLRGMMEDTIQWLAQEAV